MSVAFLVNQYPKTSHSFIRREIRALERFGLEVERFTIRWADEPLVDAADRSEHTVTTALLDNPRRLLAALVRVTARSPRRMATGIGLALRLGSRSRRGLRRHVAYLVEATRLVEELRRRNITHVHAHFGTNPAAVALLWSALSGGTFSFTVHGPEEFDRPTELSLRDKIAAAEFVIAVSNFGRSQLYRWCDHREWSKIHVVHCTVDRSFLDTWPVAVPDSPTLVCVGRLCEQKGQMVLLEAAIRVAEQRDFTLQFVGDGEFRAPIQRLIDTHGLGDRVEILGWRSGADVREAVLAARAMILPSFAEGLPVSIMEALALRRPVITTYVAGIPELVSPGVNGWLVPAGSVDDLAAAMIEVLDRSPAELTAMGAAGHSAVLANHHDDVEGRKLAALLMGGPTSPRRSSPADRAATDERTSA